MRSAMSLVILDVRARNRAGIWRYGASILVPLIEHLRREEIEAHVIAGPQDNALQRELLPRGIETTLVETPFVRWRETALGSAILRADPAVYFTTNYSYDPTISVPVVPVVHDLIRVRWPALTFDAQSFGAIFGASQLVALQEAVDFMVAELRDEAALELSGDAFHDYFRVMSTFVAARAAHVVTVSQASAADLRDIVGLPPARLTVAPGGVSTVFRPRPSLESFRSLKRHGVAPPYLVTVGQASPGKRLPWLVDALLPVLSPDESLLVVGEYAQGDSSLVLRARMSGGRVRLLGRLSDEDLASVYSAARAYVTASVAEGYGLPLQEAAACGSPVVATDIPVFRETLGTGATFYHPDDVDGLRALARASLDRGPEVTNVSAGKTAPSWCRTAAVIGQVLTNEVRRAGRPTPPETASADPDRSGGT